MDELLELGNLVVPDQAYTQIRDAGGLIALDHVDHRMSRPQSHQPMVMHPTAIVLLQKRAGEGFGPLGIRVEAYGRVDTQGEMGERPSVLCERLL